MVRLNGQIAEIFEDWLRENYPDRADKVLRQVANAHGGKVKDSRFGTRMKGEGNYASMVKRTMDIARERYIKKRLIPDFDTSLFRRPDKGQLNLWA
jgi:DNA repair photolyase